MAQHYVNPIEIVDPWPGKVFHSTKLRKILERDGQIVPLLVHDPWYTDGYYTVANDTFQRERLDALRYMEWETVLVETSWTKDDL